MAAAKLIELERARDLVLAQARPLGAEPVALREALGRRLAEDAVATEAVPAFDNSAMDGYAVRAADTRGARPGGPAALRLAGESRAGHPAATPLAAGGAIAISTGAAVPAGADAVVRVEATRREGDRVLVEEAVEAGRDVRRAGEDISAGETVLAAGARIGPAELGALASLGATAVECRRRPRVSVLTSGDELLEPGEAMRPGGVRDSNAYSVPALARLAGAEVDVTTSVADDPEATRAAIEPALGSDVAVVCGGVSVGEHDHVKRALAALGVEQRFWGVALKPGKPTWFGTRGATLVFGLPGNPVSAMVVFVLLVRPALVALAGGRPERLRTTAALASECEKRPGRAHALRCRLELGEDGWRAYPFERQGSHVLTSMLGADCLALLPSAAGSVRAGERVEVELLDLVPCQATFALSGLPSPRLAASSTARRGAATPSGLRPCQARRCLRQNRANVTGHGTSMGTMTVRVRLFAVLRERAGRDSVEIELAEGATVADALDELAALPSLAETLARTPVGMAVNRAYASPDTALGPGDELALIPPISGGAGPHARVTAEPLSLEALAAAVGRPGAGAVVAFQGVTREVSRLEYESYAEMAEERMTAILAECVERHGLEAAAAEHRTGAVALGEASVIVAVSAAHRAEAFAGAREAIDRIKAEAPIWKREVEEDGASRWAAGELPPLDGGDREPTR